MLNPEFKAKWVAALRSGEYKQINGELKTEKGHCCLGVARDACGVSTSTADDAGYLLDTDSTAAVGLDDTTQAVLYYMNDGQGKSFPEIADYIAANL
jgi:hypothetical protein